MKNATKNVTYQEIPQFSDIGEIVGQLCKEFDIGHLAGPSPDGWSRWSTFERCPQAYYLRYIKEDRVAGGLAREIGSGFHAFRALARDPEVRAEPSWLMAQLLERNANPEAVHEAWRLHTAYEGYYGMEQGVEFLAVEYPVGVKGRGTARYDGIVKLSGRPETPDGIYIWEYKTWRALTEDAVDGWDLDGEIVGQYTYWKRYRLDKVFGKLQGLCVDVTVKTKTPQFQRTFVVPRSSLSRVHLQVLNHLRVRESAHRTSRSWPKYMAGCITRGRCDYYEHCRRTI